MNFLSRFKFLLFLTTLVTFSSLGITYFPTPYVLHNVLPTMNSSMGVSLRHLVHLRVNGSIKRNIVDQYRGQLAEYFKEGKGQVHAVYKRRQNLVEEFCKKNMRDRRIRPMKNIFYYTKDPDVLYCPVAKTGSTFWERLIAAIAKRDLKTFSPFQNVNASTPKFSLTLGDHEREIRFQTYLKSRNKFVFTRDPYHRLFSVFIDKFLSPNDYMWRFGEKAIAMLRSATRKGEMILGSSVRFNEYIKYINSQHKEDINPHVKPVSYTCDLCDFKYDVIGKVETFELDVNYILKRIGVFNREIVIHDMNFERDADEIFVYVQRAFDMQKRWLKYISVHAGMQRLWRQLQINGLIDMTDTYPFSPEQSLNLTVVEYVNVALEAFRRSSPAAKHTKREAFLQAYSMVEPEDLEQLRKGYLSDFEMFDYEQQPAELFYMDRNRNFVYDYFDVMQLT